jgi:glutamyl-tRNA(Gln) amidotransferase subunit E
MPDFENFKLSHIILKDESLDSVSSKIRGNLNKQHNLVAVNLPGFKNILSFFTQPNRMFSEEISDRLKVIACIEKPNMTHSEDVGNENQDIIFDYIGELLNAKISDAQILFWSSEEDISTALDTIEERCKLAFIGVPKETRKSFADGTTMFERVLPGADRMYPDTDSAPISISQELLDIAGSNLPIDVKEQITKLEKWNIPTDAFFYLLRYNLVPLIDRICDEFNAEPKFVATLLAHKLKALQGKRKATVPFDFERIYQLFAFVKEQEIESEIIYKMLPVIIKYPKMELLYVLEYINFASLSTDSIVSLIPIMQEKFRHLKTSKNNGAELRWIMKQLQEKAIGNIPLSKLAGLIHKGGIA